MEGDRYSIEDEEGNVVEKEFKELSSSSSVKDYEIIKNGIFPSLSSLADTTLKMIDLQDKMAIEELNKVTTENGNIVDSKDGSLTPELFLESIGKMKIYFDRYGNPKPLTIIFKSNYIAQIQFILEDDGDDFDLELINFDKKHEDTIKTNLWTNSEFRNALNKKMKRDRHEWHIRESNRKLVD